MNSQSKTHNHTSNVDPTAEVGHKHHHTVSANNSNVALTITNTKTGRSSRLWRQYPSNVRTTFSRSYKMYQLQAIEGMDLLEKTMDMTTPQSALLTYGDTNSENYYGQRVISGINCIVTANNVAG